MKKLILISVISALSFSVFAQEDNQRLKDAESIYRAFEIDSIGARGAVQVSQLADISQIKYSRMIIAQNEEIIALLKQLVERNRQPPPERPTKK
jgi:hypothetical protein